MVAMFYLFKAFPEVPLSRSVANSFPQEREQPACAGARDTSLCFGANEQLSPFKKGAELALLGWQLRVLRSIVHVLLVVSGCERG